MVKIGHTVDTTFTSGILAVDTPVHLSFMSQKKMKAYQKSYNILYVGRKKKVLGWLSLECSEGLDAFRFFFKNLSPRENTYARFCLRRTRVYPILSITLHYFYYYSDDDDQITIIHSCVTLRIPCVNLIICFIYWRVCSIISSAGCLLYVVLLRTASSRSSSRLTATAPPCFAPWVVSI